MDDRENIGNMAARPEVTGSHIWLRYATQFTDGKRTHTIDIGIPVPLGASAETRERLIREAEDGMEQLTKHVESRVARMLRGQGQVSQHVPSPSVQPRPLAGKSPTSTAPASAPAATTSTTTGTKREAVQAPAPVSREVTVPPTRPNIGASMPSIPGLPGDASGSLTLQQFIRFIKESYGLEPRQAMELLGVKSLNGLNYREALEELQQVVMKEQASTPPSAPAPAPASAFPAAPSNSSSPAAAEPAPMPAGIKEIKNAVVREKPPAPVFDEEVDFDGDAGSEDYLPDLTDQEREQAEDIIARLREARGSAGASEARLKVLHNVVNDQVSDDRMEELIEGVWGATSLKKLKNDQLEALISWAKTSDDFIADVDMVLTLLQEEQYARSDR